MEKVLVRSSPIHSQIHSNMKVSDPVSDLLPDAVVPQTCQTVCLFTPTCNGYQLSADRTKCDLIGNANAVLTSETGGTVYKVMDDGMMPMDKGSTQVP